MSNNKQSSVMDENFDYVKSNEKTLPILEKIYGDCATDKTATFQVPKNKQMSNNKQSSVEWLDNELASLNFDYLTDQIGNKEYNERHKVIIEQAKAMHQEEVEDFTFEYQRQKTMTINEFYNKIFNKETK